MIRNWSKVSVASVVFAAALACFLSTAQAAVKYWDINGAAPGAGQDMDGFSDGNWNLADTNWSTSATGDVAPSPWVAGDEAVFSAGSDAEDALVTISTVAGPLTPASLTIQEGIVRLAGTALGMGANPVRVNQGAMLELPTNTIIGAAAGHVLTLDGGGVRNITVGVGTGIYPGTGTEIRLTENGGKFEVPNGANDAFSIMVYTSQVNLAPGVTSAKLVKSGPGEFRGLSNWQFTSLDVEQGLYRINGSGGSDTGFGAPTGTVTTFGGAQENTSNGSALGTSIGMTGAGASPVTRSFVLGGTGDTAIVLNASWTINGPVSGPGGLMLNGFARNDGGGATTSILGTQTGVLQLGGANTYAGHTAVNFGTLAVTGGSAIPDGSRVQFATRSVWGGNNGGLTSTFDTALLRVDASETVGSLAGGNSVRGVAQIGPLLGTSTVTLSTGADNTSSTYDGAITGVGSLKKVGTGTFNMNGAKTYTGNTTVEAGTLSTNSPSLADLADVFLEPGALLNLNFAGTDTIDSLFIDGVSQAIGTWGGTGSGATNISALFSGTGLLQVSTTEATLIAGDFDGNGSVGNSDLTLLLDNWGDAVPPVPAGWTGSQPTVDAIGNDELTALLDTWGDVAGAGSLNGAAVPEPATAVLLLIAAVGMVGRVRR